MKIPAITVYTENMPKKDGGYTIACLVLIRPKYRDDPGLHAHEIEGHVKNWWTWTLLSFFLFLFSAAIAFQAGLPEYVFFITALSPLTYGVYYLTPWGRLREEVNAYRIQLTRPPATTNPSRYTLLYAGFIAHNYGLKVSIREALNKLTEQ